MIAACAAVVRGAERLLSALACACLAVIMLCVSADVFMRYALSRPFAFTYDLVGTYLLASVFFLSLSEAHGWRAHVSVESLIRGCPPWMRHGAEIITCIVGIVVFGAIAWFTGRRALGEFALDTLLTGEVPLPTWTAIAMAPIGTGLLAIRLVLELAGLLLGRSVGLDPVPFAGLHGPARGFE